MRFQTPRDPRRPCPLERAIEARKTGSVVALVQAPGARWEGQRGETPRTPVPRLNWRRSNPTPLEVRSDDHPAHSGFQKAGRRKAVRASRPFAAPEQGTAAQRAEYLRR